MAACWHAANSIFPAMPNHTGLIILSHTLAPLPPPSLATQGGLWIPCAGSKTPWGSHMGGEEYEPDARPFSEVCSGGAALLLPPVTTVVPAAELVQCTSRAAATNRWQGQAANLVMHTDEHYQVDSSSLHPLPLLLYPLPRSHPQAKTLDELKALLKGGWSDVEGFMASLSARVEQ